MAAITTYADFAALIESSTHASHFCGLVGNGSPSQSSWASSWLRFTALSGATTPSLPVVCDQATNGNLMKHPRLPGTCSNQLWLSDLEFALSIAQPGGKCSAVLYDRLCHQGGLDGTSAVAQTTNLPTAPLTRYTSGVGVVPCLEIYVPIGATSVTASISYTNQAGVAGQISPDMAITNGNGNQGEHFTVFSLAAGDTGCRSVESVTLSASTGTVGNFGITLVKRLALLPPDTGAMVERQAYRNLFFGGGIVEILPSACPMIVMMINGGSGTGAMSLLARIGVVEK
jgi:hypothetical protein